MIALPPQAGKALKEKEAEEKGKLWVEEVSTEEGLLFADYEKWFNVYEASAPAKENVKPKKGVVSTVAERNDQALDTIRSNLTSKLALMTLDMASHLLQELETSLNDDPMINAIRALVFTYRFEKPNMRRKIFHLRQVACQRLTELLEVKLREESLKDSQQSFRDGLAELDTKPVLEQVWKQWMADAFVEIKETDSPVRATVPSDTVLTIAGLLPPQQVATEESSTYEQSLIFLKGLRQAKLLRVNEFLSLAMDQFLMDFCTAKFSPDITSKQALPMTEQLILATDKLHTILVQSIEQDVSGVVDVLGNMMRLDEKEKTPCASMMGFI